MELKLLGRLNWVQGLGVRGPLPDSKWQTMDQSSIGADSCSRTSEGLAEPVRTVLPVSCSGMSHLHSQTLHLTCFYP